MVLKSLLPAYGGFTIARDEKVILIRGAIPGEVVEVAIEERKKDYSVAKVVNVLESSEHRTAPKCPVFHLCGGCQLQFVTPEKQVLMKDEIIMDSLQRLGGIETPLQPALSDLAWNYRHRTQLKITRNGDIGFFRKSSREVVTFQSCYLLHQKINALVQQIKEIGMVGELSEIHMAFGDSPIVYLKGRDFKRSLAEAYRQMGFSGIMLDDELRTETAYTHFDLNGVHYTVSPRTFFQAHWSLNQRVVEFVLKELMPLSGKQVLDLYAGAGNFSLPLSLHAEEVIAVEENPFAVEDGIRNVELNNRKNCKFVMLPAEKYKIKKKFDVLILDPPRPGLTSDMAKKILDNPADTLIYISCNPSTLARDLKKLRDKYTIQTVRQIDFFPNTFHIETIVFLKIR